ncbi:MAG: hypothetical protein HN712_15200 [Gemmatimonadetes bacterium]|jgi:ATP:ADP antiporter, AAA family|nr:hypothetical protein [Gemmatimonadota bacterium]MBT7861667.1 hypothetical protein [Gemmatimonadota bacterium]
MAALFDVRRHELSRLVPLTVAYGLVMASLYVLKPARNALFLDEQGIGELPYVLMLVALVGGGAALVFSQLARRWRLDRLILSTFVFLGFCLIGFRLLLPYGMGWSYYLFYVFVNLYGLMATSLLWLQANATFDAREGRRLFGFIGTAGILGAIIGGGLTSWLVGITGTENLLLICSGMIATCLLLLYPLRSRDAASDMPPAAGEVVAGAWETVRNSQLLSLLATMGGLVAIVAAIIDVQFNDIVDSAFTDRDAKTAFFGEFFAGLSAFALLFQLLVTPRVLRSLGVTSALLFLPASMALGSVAVLFIPGLLAGVLLKIGDGGLRHSIHKSATEILYLPVPVEAKKRTKVLLDTTVDNIATGIGAVIVLLALAAGADYPDLAWISLGLVAVWFILIGRSRGAYVDTFRRALERREIDLGEHTVDVSEAGTLDSLLESLWPDGSARRLVYALEMVATVRSGRIKAAVIPLLEHEDGDVRERALRVLQIQAGAMPMVRFEELLTDPHLGVRAQALYALCLHGDMDRSERLRQAVESDVRAIRSAAVSCIAEHGTEMEHEIVDEELVRRLLTEAAADEQELVQVARLLGNLAHAHRRPYVRAAIEELLASEAPQVVRQVIESIGRLADHELLGQVVQAVDDRRYQRAAGAALAQYGEVALPPLIERIGNLDLDARVRQRAARALAQIELPATVDRIFACIESVEPSLQYHLLKTLSKLRNRNVHLHFDPALVRDLLSASADDIELLRHIRVALEGTGHGLLQRALREKVDQYLKRVFRLLGLLYPQRDLYNAYLGYVDGKSDTRASSLELLENLLAREDRDRVLPALDPSAEVVKTDLTAELAVEQLLSAQDPWLRACATHSFLHGGDEVMRQRLGQLEQDRHPLVREAAVQALRAV